MEHRCPFKMTHITSQLTVWKLSESNAVNQCSSRVHTWLSELLRFSSRSWTLHCWLTEVQEQSKQQQQQQQLHKLGYIPAVNRFKMSKLHQRHEMLKFVIQIKSQSITVRKSLRWKSFKRHYCGRQNPHLILLFYYIKVFLLYIRIYELYIYM